MYAPENTITVGLTGCLACGAEQSRPDKFCRQCGASQRLEVASLTNQGDWADWPDRNTQPLPNPKHYDSFAGVLMNLVMEGVSVRNSSLSSSLAAMRLASVLVLVPLWLMIVLLSPLDAYAAARTITKRAMKSPTRGGVRSALSHRLRPIVIRAKSL